MADPTIDDLMNPPTTEEIKESIYKTMAELDVETAGWKPGGIVRTLISVFAACLQTGYELVALIARGGFLDTADGEWLTLLAHGQYEVDRLPASFATGQATVTNTGGGEFIFYPGDMVMVIPPGRQNSGRLYVNTAEVTLHSHSVVPNVPIRAKEAGAASNAAPGDITELVTPFIGVSVTNTTNMIAIDGESDAALRRRCRDKPFSLSVFGPPGAYRYWAKMATHADGTPVGVNRARLPSPPGDGTLEVIVATANMVFQPTDRDDILKILKERAAPVQSSPIVVLAEAVQIDVTCEVWIYDSSNLNEASLKTLVGASLQAFFQEEPIGGNSEESSGGGGIKWSAILSAIYTADPKRGIFRVDMTQPAGDIVLTERQVAMFRGPINLTVHTAPSRVE